MSDILQLRNVRKSFGAVVVADDVTFDLQEGQALGVIGPNGAGKTSMFNLITGMLSSDSGQIIFDGVDITKQSAAKRCRAGLARSFQVPQPFSGMTVFEIKREANRGRQMAAATCSIKMVIKFFSPMRSGINTMVVVRVPQIIAILTLSTPFNTL